MQALKDLFLSPRFQALLIGVIFAIIKAVWPAFPMSEEMLLGVFAVIVSFILGLSIRKLERRI
jgi:xanthosine utilization system XapX-like protein